LVVENHPILLIHFWFFTCEWFQWESAPPFFLTGPREITPGSHLVGGDPSGNGSPAPLKKLFHHVGHILPLPLLSTHTKSFPALFHPTTFTPNSQCILSIEIRQKQRDPSSKALSAHTLGMFLAVSEWGRKRFFPFLSKSLTIFHTTWLCCRSSRFNSKSNHSTRTPTLTFRVIYFCIPSSQPRSGPFG